MNRALHSMALIGVTLSLVLVSPCHSMDLQQNKDDWQGIFSDGTKLTKDDLARILSDHQKWIETGGMAGKRADLSMADLREVNLSETDLREAVLRNSNLSKSNLSNSNLFNADLSRAHLREANLAGAYLYKTNLELANLLRANLRSAHLSDTKLTKADLRGANLSYSKLLHTNLEGAYFANVDLTNSWYEPCSAPSAGSVGGIRGITRVQYSPQQQTGLALLKKAFKESGLRKLEREATYIIEHRKTNLSSWPERYFKLLFFEWPSGYGLYYERPLMILGLILLVCSFIYVFPLLGFGKYGIYQLWPEDRIDQDRGKEKIDRVVRKNPFKLITYALWFSILSTFRIGWRELDLASWLVRLQSREYVLRATGWVKTVSAAQSLTCVYLVALWALSYFGRPFE